MTPDDSRASDRPGSTDPAPRRYSERETSLLLRRAAELQQEEPTRGAARAGLTLSELEEIATEAGIDPRYLRRAAGELEAGAGGTLWSKVTGAPVAFVLERTVEGEFPESEFEELVPLISSTTLGQGTASTVGRTLTWTSRSDTNTSSQQVLVSSRNGRTVIRIEERLGGLAGALFGGIMAGGTGLGIGGGATLGGALGSVAFAVAAPVTVLAGSYIVARSVFASRVREHRASMEGLLHRIVERVEAAVDRRRVAGEGEGARGRLAGGGEMDRRRLSGGEGSEEEG